MVGRRHRVAFASALSAAAGELVWVLLVTAGMSPAVAAVIAIAAVIALASLAPRRVGGRLFSLAFGYAFAFAVIEFPLLVVLLFVLNPPGRE
jgi:chromate transport protein ChrA